MAKITKENFKEQLVDHYRQLGYTATKRTYGNVYDISKPGINNFKVRLAQEEDFNGIFVEAGSDYRQLKHPKAIIKKIDKEFDEQQIIQDNQFQANSNLETTKRVMTAMGFDDSLYQINSYATYTSVLMNIDNCDPKAEQSVYKFTCPNRLAITLARDGSMAFVITTKTLNLEQLALAKERMDQLEEAWSISTL